MLSGFYLISFCCNHGKHDFAESFSAYYPKKKKSNFFKLYHSSEKISSNFIQLFPGDPRFKANEMGLEVCSYY